MTVSSATNILPAVETPFTKILGIGVTFTYGRVNKLYLIYLLILYLGEICKRSTATLNEYTSLVYNSCIDRNAVLSIFNLNSIIVSNNKKDTVALAGAPLPETVKEPKLTISPLWIPMTAPPVAVVKIVIDPWLFNSVSSEKNKLPVTLPGINEVKEGRVVYSVWWYRNGTVIVHGTNECPSNRRGRQC